MSKAKLLAKIVSSSLSGLVKMVSGSPAAAVAGTDYQAPIGTITGLAKGGGANALTAAAVRTDYAEPTTALATGLLKNTTITGAHTIATAGTDYVAPTGSDGLLTRQMLKDCGYTGVDKGTVASGTVTFDYTEGSVQRVQVGGALTLAFSNWPPSGNLGDFLIEVVNGNAGAISGLTVVKWKQPDGSDTTDFPAYMTAIGRASLQASGSDWLYVWSKDAGTTIWGKAL